MVLAAVNVTTNFSSCPSRGAAVRVTVTYPFNTVLGKHHRQGNAHAPGLDRNEPHRPGLKADAFGACMTKL